MDSHTQALLSKGSEAEWQGLGDITPSFPSPHVDGCGQGEPGVQAPTDNAWAIAFKLNVVFTFLLAIYGSSMAHDVWRLLEVFGLHPSHVLLTVLMACLVMVPLAYGTSWILLRSIVHSASWMVQVSAAISLLMCFGAVNTLLSAGMMLAAAELAVVCGLITYLVFRRRGSIEFAASNLKAAALCVKSTPNIMFWALCMMATRAMWYGATVMALIGLADSSLLQYGIFDTLHHTTSTTAEFFSISLLWELSAVWQFTLTGNVVAATVARSVSSWCSSPENVEPVRESFCRVWRYSLGSLCKAAMVEGIIAVVLQFVSVLFITVGAPIFPVFCVWLVARSAAQYTVLFVAMHRLSFSEGADRALAILRKHGLTIRINNTLIAAGFSVLLSIVTVSLSAVLLAFSSTPMSPNLLTRVFLLVVIAAVVVTIEVVINSFKAVFVYFMQDPEAFAEVHGARDQDGVYRAWRRMQRVHPAVGEDEEGIEF